MGCDVKLIEKAVETLQSIDGKMGTLGADVALVKSQLVVFERRLQTVEQAVIVTEKNFEGQ